MATDYPARGQQAPVYWDVQLRQWIEEAPLAGGAFAAALVEAVQDVLGSSLQASGASVSYDDATGKTTISITGVDAEAARDTIGAAMRVSGGLTLTVDDPGDTITIGVNGLMALPVTGVKVVQQFIYTDPTVARPAVPSYVALDWIGPAGSGSSAPTNMAVGDTWDLQS